MPTSSFLSALPPRTRLRAVLLVAVVAALLVGVIGYAATRAVGRPGRADGADRSDSRAGTAPGVLRPGRPSVQRFQQDGVDVTVSLTGARPGPNLVRVDLGTTSTDDRADDWHVLVGTTADDESDQMVVARPRAGVDGLWARVDLPRGTSTLLVSHGPDQRVPFPVDTGTAG